jgi:hypothetical protein
VKNYKEIKKGVYESERSLPVRPIDEARIREIMRDKSAVISRHDEGKKVGCPSDDVSKDEKK